MHHLKSKIYFKYIFCNIIFICKYSKDSKFETLQSGKYSKIGCFGGQFWKVLDQCCSIRKPDKNVRFSDLIRNPDASLYRISTVFYKQSQKIFFTAEKIVFMVYLKTSKKGKAEVSGSARAARKHIVPASPSYKLKESKRIKVRAPNLEHPNSNYYYTVGIRMPNIRFTSF